MTTWGRKRAHLIMESVMQLFKPEDIMKTYPSTDNNLEAFHSTFAHAVPRTALPLFLAVSMTYHFTENCRSHAESMLEGDRKANRKRGSQHDRKRLPKDFHADEWVQRPPENANALRPRKKPRRR